MGLLGMKAEAQNITVLSPSPQHLQFSAEKTGFMVIESNKLRGKTQRKKWRVLVEEIDGGS